MKLNIKQMNYDEAIKISKWTYGEPYSMYNLDGSDECIKEFLDGYHFSAINYEENELMGYYCFGKSAQVPIGMKFGVYDEKGVIDVGVGLKPSLCGQGIGADFLKAGLEFARNKLQVQGFRLTVACFNKRAIKVYEKLGFKKVAAFERILGEEKVGFQVMALK